jgi:ASPM-SPD-2-Hydin domain-containing protein/centrosomal CEP192-like protein/dockerin type I repeat protein
MSHWSLSGKAAILATILFCVALRLPGQDGPTVQSEEHHDTSPPLSDLATQPAATTGVQGAPEAGPMFIAPLPLGFKSPDLLDAVLQSTASPAPDGLGPVVLLNIDGLGQGVFGFTPRQPPPDTNGAAGLTQYVQWVNSSFAVFDKATGALQLGPLSIVQFWAGYANGCQIDSFGDGVVLFDKIANRWVISHLSFNPATNRFQECVAVSTSADARGTYNRYSFDYAFAPDYPKIGVWPDAYYVTFNGFPVVNSGITAGARACAYDRDAMLNGRSATQICFTLNSLFHLLPSDFDGTALPPQGSPNYMVRFGVNSLHLYKFHVNFNASSATLTGPIVIPVEPFTPLCSDILAPNTDVCVLQLLPQRLHALGDRLMYRLAYRNFGSWESLAVNHSVKTPLGGGVRWYEVRNPSGIPIVAQQSTFAPDFRFRWMGSIAMDHAGDMGMGYSVSSFSQSPGIAFAGRLFNDPTSTMQTEITLQEPLGSQSGSDRWGDYSAMQIDPVDDCTFWYTTEYLQNSGLAWNTRIAAIKFPSCFPIDFQLFASPASLNIVQGAQASTLVTVVPFNSFAGSVDLSVTGLPPGVSATFIPASTTQNSTLTLTVSKAAAPGTKTLVIAGVFGALRRTTSLTLTIVPAPTAAVNPPSLAFGDTVVGGVSNPQTVTLTNLGPGTLNAPNILMAGDFVQTNNCVAPLPAGASCTINVRFAPTAIGTRSGAMAINDNASNSPQTVTLSGSAFPGNFAFAPQSAGSRSPVQTLILSNLTSSNRSIVIGVNGDFNQTNNCPIVLAPNVSCIVSIAFAPTGIGTRNGTLVVTETPAATGVPDSPQTTSLVGTAIPGSLAFAPQATGTTSPAQTFVLSNVTSTPLANLALAPNGDFQVSSNCGNSLAVSANCTVSVTFSPTTPGPRTGSLMITSNAINSPQTVSLGGSAFPASLAFAGQIVQTQSSPQVITIANNTGSPLTFPTDGMVINGTDFTFSTTCVSPLAVNASCTISVTFTPSATGNRTATLSITDNIPGSPQLVSLSGTGLPLIPVLNTISPPMVTTGSSDFRLFVNGSSFAGNAVVQVNGSPRSTRFINFMQLSAAIPASDLTGSQPLSITVFNPLPSAATSAAVSLALTSNPIPLISNVSPVRVRAGDNNPPLQLTVNGSFFSSDSVVQIASNNRVTRFISPNQLVATILPSDQTASGLPPIQVISATAGTSANTVPLVVFKYGDLNFDNMISVSDLLVEANILAGNVIPQDPAPADLNLDGIANVSDLITLANYLAGNIFKLPILQDQTLYLFNAGAPVSLSSPVFPGQTVGTTSDPIPLTLTNGGPTPLTVSNIIVNGNFAQTNNCVTLGANQSCTINVTFNPTAAGLTSGTITIQDNALNSPQTATLSGSGIGSAAPTAMLSIGGAVVDSPALAFGSQSLGADSAFQVVTLTNQGPGRLTFQSIGMLPDGDFNQISDCGISLAAGASCSIYVTFSPAATGTRSATLVVTDSAGNSPQTVSLSGTGVTNGPG